MMKGVSLVCLLVLASGLTLASKIRYDGYKVFRVTPKTDHHVKLLQQLEKIGVSFWEGPSTIGKSSDIMLPPHLQGDMLQTVLKSGAPVVEYISNVQTLMDAEKVSTKKGVRLDWTQYSRLEEIYEFLDEEAAKHSDIASVVTIGQSSEGRDLKIIKISKSGETKPAIWIDSNIHAREWISGAVGTYLINQLLNSEDAELQSWTEDFDFYLMPIANPDGFEYSHTTDRMWRKTRSETDSPFGCKGADPNRNFGYKWFTGGSSGAPCDETYAGDKAFSEPETLAISEYFNTIADRAVAFISIHSYSQYILLPYGVEDEELPAEEHQEYLRIANKAADAISTRYGTEFVSGSVTDLLYPASGGSMDWVKGIHNTNLTLSFELRDQGQYGFMLPANQITSSSLEFIDGLQVFVDELRAGITPPERKAKPTLGLKSPVNPIFFDRQTFGAVPSKVHGPIIPGFQRH